MTPCAVAYAEKIRQGVKPGRCGLDGDAVLVQQLPGCADRPADGGAVGAEHAGDHGLREGQAQVQEGRQDPVGKREPGCGACARCPAPLPAAPGTAAVEGGGELGGRAEAVRRRVHKAVPRHVDAARDAARAAVGTGALAAERLRGQGVDEAGGPILGFLADVGQAGEELWPGTGAERRGRVGALARLDWAVCRDPGGKPAVEHAGVIVPEVAQQPPQPRRPHWRVLRVRDDVRAVADAEAADRGGEVLRRGKGEREGRRRVGQCAGDIGEPGSGNMGSRVAFAPALHGIRAAACRVAEEDGGVERAHSLITERVAEFLGADQWRQQWHLGNLLEWPGRRPGGCAM